MLHCKFSGDCNSEKNFKIGKYLTKLCVQHLGFTFFGPPCRRRTVTVSDEDYSCLLKMGKANCVFGSLKDIWKSKCISLKVKVRLYD